MKKLLFFISVLQLFACAKEVKPQYELFVGTYTRKEGHVDGKGEGVYRLFLDSNFNEIKTRQIIGGVINPSWIALENDLLFCAEETTPDGKITSFKLEGDKANLVNSVSSKGGAPCHLACQEGKLIVANYVGSNAVSFTYDKNGKLSEALSDIHFLGKGVTSRQEASHPHQIVMNYKVPEVYVTDLGTDTIFTLTYDKNGILKRVKEQDRNVDAGDGPRHWVGGYTWYVLNELSSSISVLTNFGQEKLQKISTLPADFQGKNTTAEIVMNGNFIYATNRGHNSIAIFKIKDESGQLELVGFEPTRGDCPRNMTISPDNKFLFCANQNSDNVLIFKFLESGKLEFEKELNVKTPVCLTFRNVR